MRSSRAGERTFVKLGQPAHMDDKAIKEAHLHPYALFDAHLLINEHSNKVEVGVAGSRVGDLDFLETAFYELQNVCEGHRRRSRRRANKCQNSG